ncbi:MAG: sugar transferase [Bacteroidales bacterium]|nr:sugar transferase [Bacteroidales bacterium]
MSSADKLLKYIFDRIVALTGLLILWPAMLVVGLTIAISMPDGGPFFFQKRVGKDGRLFTIVKFRTMYVSEQDRNGRPVPAAVRFIRRFKLDELPQLWNVLTGRMSLVGPRPDVPGYADKLTGEDAEILQLRPGITGPASLKYRCEEELLASVPDPLSYNDNVIYPDKVRINRYYLHNYSFFTDMKIIWATVTGRKIFYGGEWI